MASATPGSANQQPYGYRLGAGAGSWDPLHCFGTWATHRRAFMAGFRRPTSMNDVARWPAGLRCQIAGPTTNRGPEGGLGEQPEDAARIPGNQKLRKAWMDFQP